MVIFARQNLIKDPPFARIDILSCRNFLIYITKGLQGQLMLLFHYSLNPEGLLFLGTSENIGNFTDLFKPVDSKWKIFICQKTPGLVRTPLIFDNTNKSEMHNMANGKKLGEEMKSDIAQSLLQHYTPACIVIDEKGSIIYFHGKLNNYLQPKSGPASLNILEMAHPDLKEKIVSAIHQLDSQEKKQVFYPIFPLKVNNNLLYVNLRVLPFKKTKEQTHWKLIIIEECEPEQKIDETKVAPITVEDFRQQMISVDQELKDTKDNLTIAIDEIKAENEGLAYSNKELSSINEDLQSINEELETSKEELQSLNEELTTVNNELELQIEVSSKINDDFKNLLYSTDIAVIFLDNNLRIKRFTPKLTKIIPLIQTDIGRSISDIVSTLQYDTFVDDIKEVLDTVSSRVVEVQNKEKNCWYEIKIMLYRTVNNAIDGVVITFWDITKQKASEVLIKHLQEDSEAKLLQDEVTKDANK